MGTYTLYRFLLRSIEGSDAQPEEGGFSVAVDSLAGRFLTAKVITFVSYLSIYMVGVQLHFDSTELHR